MNLRTLLIAVMSLIATTMSAQETATKTAYAVYCTGSEAENDPATLYFLAAETKPTGTHNGQEIAKNSENKECVWSGTDVTNAMLPAWSSFAQYITRVVFEESFKDVKPTSCYSWFNGCSKLATIEGIANLNTESVTTMRNMFQSCLALRTLDLSNFKTDNVTNMSYMFSNCKALESLTLGGNFNTENVTAMNSMFYYCSALKTLNLSNFKTEKVKDMEGMFNGCSALESLTFGDNFKTDNVTTMKSMFNYCSALETLNLSSFNTESVTTMEYMFCYCKALKALNLSNFNTAAVINMSNMFGYCRALDKLDLSNFNTKNVTDMGSMFSGCNALGSLTFGDNFKTDNVTTMKSMFSGCNALETLNLSSFNTENVKNMSSMFSGCSTLDKFDLSNFKTDNVTTMTGMFYGCKALESITFGSGFTTANVKEMGSMFYECSALKTLDLSGFNIAAVTNINSMFNRCSALESLILGSDINKAEKIENMSFMFYGCSALKTLDLSNFKTDNVTGMSNMFNGCSALTSLTLGSNFKTDNVTNMIYIFRDCNSLLSLDLRNADKAVDMVKTGNFAKRGMAIYLPADADVSDAVFEENFVIKPDANSTSFARKFTSGNMSTLCLPFAVNTADVTAGTFYEFKGRSDDGKTVKFGKPASGSTEADKAYIFKPSTGDKVTFTGTAIDGLPELTEGDANGLYGVYTKKEFTPDEADRNIYYGWSAGKFVSIGAGATLNPGRAYLKLSQTSGAKNILNAVFDDETTSISDVNAPDCDDSAPAYDLMGRRVGAGYKGIVIKNGKKGPLPASPKGR